MKKEHKTYLLLTVVFLLWGLIGYQFFKKLNPSDSEIASSKFRVKFTPEKVEKPNFYTVIGVDRDPFLGKYAKKKVIVKKIKKPIPKPTVFLFQKLYTMVLLKGTIQNYIF